MRQSLFILVVLTLLLTLSSCVVDMAAKHTSPLDLINSKIDYSYVLNDRANTFEGYYKKQLTADRYAQSEMTLSHNQQLLILNQALVRHFFQMPDTLGLAPADHFLRIASGQFDKTVHWSGGLNSLRSDSLRRLVVYIDSIVRSTDAYMQLPASQLTSP